MNEIIKSLHDRRSVRVFTEQPVSGEDKRIILEAAVGREPAALHDT